MTSEIKYIYRLNGQYIGFIDDGGIFNWEGKYLGWVEDQFAWDRLGQFRGKLMNFENNSQTNYILKDKLALPPIPKTPKKEVPAATTIPTPQAPVRPISASRLGLVDGF